MFSIARKQAQQIARQFLSGHCTLIAWWTLRHAGVLEAMLKYQTESGEGLDPLVYATRTNMSPDILQALLNYLASAGLVTLKKDGAHLSGDGKALLEHEDAVLELVRAYQPVLDMAEHLLAKLKTYAPAGLNGGATGAGTGAGGTVGSVLRKAEYLIDSQAKRYAAEVYPAVANLIAKHKLSHVMDISCGAGDLLMHIAREHKRVVGVGIGADAIAVRRANAAITAADLEKRLIAVAASSFDVCTQTQRTFDRIGVSRQLWKEINGLVATGLFSELTARPEDIARILAALPKNFPTATLLLIEPVASPRFDRNYYAPELTLLLNLARSYPWPAEQWREALAKARYRILEETPLNTDGLTIFVCKPG